MITRVRVTHARTPSHTPTPPPKVRARCSPCTRSVRAMRCSLDRQLLALCRSLCLVELVDLTTGNISVHTL